MRAAFSLGVLALLLAHVGAPEGAAARARPRPYTHVVVNRGPIHADGGAILVAAVPIGGSGGRRRGFDSVQLRSGDTVIETRREELSPVLARYIPVTPPPPGEYRLSWLSRTVRFVAGSAAPRLHAPDVSAVQRGTIHRRRTGPRPRMRVVLASPPPAGAIAIHVETAEGGVVGVPIDGAATTINVYPWNLRGQRLPPRLEQPPRSGSEVRVRFINADGVVGDAASVVVVAMQARRRGTTQRLP